MKKLNSMQMARRQESSVVPQEGPLVVVAHQAFELVASLALVRSLRRTRHGVRVLACREVTGGCDLEGAALWVDPLGGVSARLQNQAALREAQRFVQSGGALIVFTSGAVELREPGYRQLLGLAWQSSMAAFIQQVNGRVVPASFIGCTDDEPHGVIYGELISTEELDRAERSGSMISFLRLATGSLARWNAASTSDGVGNKLWRRLIEREGLAVRPALVELAS